MRGNLPLLSDDLETLFGAGALGSQPDRELLTRFVSKDDAVAAETAFAALVSRHGPMVLGVCRRMLRDAHLADDAFQAVFLILARKAHSVRVDDSLGRWLYGVTVRVAGRARALAASERGRSHNLEGIDKAGAPPECAACERDDQRAVIDEEIARLPLRYRAPVMLCYFEGLTGEQAARKLRCPVGTLESRLHRARERLRASFTRRGLATPAAGAIKGLAALTMRAEVPIELAVATAAAAASVASGGTIVGIVSAASAALVKETMRSMLMIKGLWTGFILVLIGLSASGAVGLTDAGNDDGKNPNSKVLTIGTDAKKLPARFPLADRFKQILAEYEAKQDALRTALKTVTRQSEINKTYQQMSPDEAAFCRQMLELAASAPGEPVARDALVWVINKPGMRDSGAYGDEFARAASMLVRHHGDDPTAVRVGLGLDNVVTPHRDALLTGFYAAAKCREAKGLARLALAQYLAEEAKFIAGTRSFKGRQKNRFIGLIDDNGRTYEKEVEQSDEEYSYVVQLRLRDAGAVRTEAERLFEEVIADYGDVPFRTQKDLELEALSKDPAPRWNGKLLTSEERRQVAEHLASRKQTLAEIAEARLDNMRNLIPGKPAPEINGFDMNGKPLKLSDFRGKVVVLVFWGSWCGPCMREVSHERELVERLKDKPFALLGVNCGDEKQAALKAIRDEKMTWPQWFDDGPEDGAIVKTYRVTSFPTIFVLDAQGTIRQKKILGSALDKAVDALLAGRDPEEHDGGSKKPDERRP